MARYWVIGGEYADTRFERPAEGGEERRYGPFASYDDARAEWSRLAWASVDNAHCRFRIEQQDAAPDVAWWVVGGRYDDTAFHQAEGGEQWHGPFASRQEALDEWRRRAWATVDDALTRYRIEQRPRGEGPPAESPAP